MLAITPASLVKSVGSPHAHILGQAVTPIQLRISGSGTIILCFGDAVATKLWLTYYRSERMLRI